MKVQRSRSSLQETHFRLIKVTVALEEYDILDEITEWLTKLVLIAFLLLSQMLLLNVLIVDMNNTHKQVGDMKNVIGTILLIER